MQCDEVTTVKIEGQINVSTYESSTDVLSRQQKSCQQMLGVEERQDLCNKIKVTDPGKLG